MNNFLYNPRKYNTIDLWKNVTEEEWYDSKWQIKNSIKNVDDLSKIVKLNNFQINEIKRTLKTLKEDGKDPMRITPYYSLLMQENPFNPKMLDGEKEEKRLDPIFWQCVPTPANLLFQNAGTEDSMSEEFRSYGSAYQRYPNRLALFVAKNTSCASYCVHCQRAKTLDNKANVDLLKINKGLFYINYNKNIDEVLVTGGDSLMINKDLLRYILEELSKIHHLRVIRIATRVPVVMPMGITDEILDIIKTSSNKYTKGTDKYVYFMTHINHYQEITDDLAKAVKRIQEYGFAIRNQTVFLNHVNDYYKTLAETFRRMLWVGVQPYYLLQCHKEKGIIHFIVPVQVGQIYMKHLQGWLSGITIPKYAANIEGGGGKVLLMPSGYDLLHINADIEDKISESYANVLTWDSKKMINYEALGRSTKKEFNESVKIMDKFIGRTGVFLPKLIIINEEGKYIETTNRTKLPQFEKSKKSKFLDYDIFEKNLPLTNPYTIRDELDKKFNNNNYNIEDNFEEN